jgi:hypothetical protein
VKGVRRRVFWRWTRRFFGVALALIAALLVSVLTIDLGRIDWLRQQAEKRGTDYLKRPIHIGGISIGLLPGKFVLRDVTIEGTPDSRPFFTVKRIEVNVSWTTLIHKNRSSSHLSIGRWRSRRSRATGQHPAASHTRRRGAEQVENVQLIRPITASSSEDHVTPWMVIARTSASAGARGEPAASVGKAHFDGGTIAIQKFQPWTPRSRALRPRRIARPAPRIDLLTSGAESHVNGVLDTAPGPADLGQARGSTSGTCARSSSPTRRTGRRRRRRDWCLPSLQGGRELTGDFSSDGTDVNELHFFRPAGTLVWDW